jgi:hypothetical protein
MWVSNSGDADLEIKENTKIPADYQINVHDILLKL